MTYSCFTFLVGSPKHLQLDENPLICKNSQIFYNSTLKGGYKAGNYTKFGKVANMSACIRRCCGNKDCDAAMMLENNCFAVACTDADNCLPVHAKDSGSLASLNPRLSFITSRSEEGKLSVETFPFLLFCISLPTFDKSFD